MCGFLLPVALLKTVLLGPDSFAFLLSLAFARLYDARARKSDHYCVDPSQLFVQMIVHILSRK